MGALPFTTSLINVTLATWHNSGRKYHLWQDLYTTYAVHSVEYRGGISFVYSTGYRVVVKQHCGININSYTSERYKSYPAQHNLHRKITMQITLHEMQLENYTGMVLQYTTDTEFSVEYTGVGYELYIQ